MLVYMPMTIGFCFNVKKNLPSIEPQAQIDAEFDSPELIAAIKKALESGGHQVFEIEANQEAYFKLYKLKNQLDIVFNIAEGCYGDAREAQIPAMCDLLQIPYTFSSALTHAIKLNKALTKKVLIFHHLSTPPFQLFTDPQQQLDPKLGFPVLLKPNSEGSSKGILNANLVYKRDFRKRLGWMFQSYHQEVLVEEFLPGREFTVALLGNPPQALPIIEQRLDQLPKKFAPFTSYEVKWLWEDTLTDPCIAYDCPAKINLSLQKKLTDISLATFQALHCRDAARVDIRLDKFGEPQVLEINTLPGFNPDENIISYFPIAARNSGLTYNEMILAILEAACKRYNLRY